MSIQKKNFSEIIQFTRASGGTSFRPVGRGTLVNQLLWSGSFTNTAQWGSLGLSFAVTPGPTGQADATIITVTDSTTTILSSAKFPAVATTSAVTVAYVLKANGDGNQRTLLLRNSSTSTNFQGGGFSTLTGEVTGAGWQSTPLGNSWFLLTFTQSSGISTGNSLISYVGFVGGPAAGGLGTSLVVHRVGLFQGTITAQQIIDNGGIPLTFTAADNLLRLDTPGDPIQLFTAPANYPRRDYDPVTGACKGLLVEEQRTNLLTYSNDFANAAWVKSPSGVGVAPQVSTTLVDAPDGTLTASRVTLNNTGTTSNDWSWLLSNISCTSGLTYCANAWIRASTPSDVGKQILWPGVGGLSLKTLTANWQLVENTAVCTANGTYSFGPRLRGTETTANSVQLDIWQAQVEVGAFATSRIPTSGAAATRATDIPVINTLSPWYNPTEGTVLIDVGGSKPSGIALAAAASLIGSNVATTYIIPYIGSSTVGAVISGGGGNVSSGVAVAGQAAKMALGLSPASQSLVVNGGTPITRTAAAPLDLITALRIGCYESNPGALNSHIKRIQYIPKRLSDAKLQAMTQPQPFGLNLLTNGDFSNGTAEWSEHNGAQLSVSSGVLTVTNGASGRSGATRQVATVVGRYYELSGLLIAGTNAQGWLIAGTAAGGAQLLGLVNLVGQQSGFFMATSTTTYITLMPAFSTAGLTFSFDNVSLREATL